MGLFLFNECVSEENREFRIYCETSEPKENWDRNWNQKDRTNVYWGINNI